MKIAILDKSTLGDDIDLSPILLWEKLKNLELHLLSK